MGYDPEALKRRFDRFSVHCFLMIFPDELSAPAAECQKYLCKSNIILVQQYGSTVVVF